jgi:hypothetical protein
MAKKQKKQKSETVEQEDSTALNKKNCQALLQDVESIIYDYNDSFPNSVGDSVRNWHWVYMAILTIASIAIVIMRPMSMNYVLVFSALLGLMDGIGYFYSYNKGNGVFRRVTQYNTVLNQCKDKLKAYAEYSDVSKYLQSLEPYLKQIGRKKTKFRMLAAVVFLGYMAVVGGYVGYIWLYEYTGNRQPLENIHPADGLGVYPKILELYNIQINEPFFTLNPLDSSTTNQPIDFFIVQKVYEHKIDGVMLRFPFPKEYYFHHLEITNTDGKVALKGYRDSDNYNGETGCVVLGVDSTFAINALIYLHDNAGNLRYRIAQ